MYKNHKKILITAAILAMNLCACGKSDEMLKQDTAKADLQQTEEQVIEVVPEEPTLTMEYKDFTFTWIHGEGETLRGED